MEYLTINFIGEMREKIIEYVERYGQDKCNDKCLDISDSRLIWLCCPGLADAKHVRLIRLLFTTDDLSAEVEPMPTGDIVTVKYESNPFDWAPIYNYLVEVYGEITNDNQRIVITSRKMSDSEIRLTVRELTLMALRNKSVASLILNAADEYIAAHKKLNPLAFSIGTKL